MRALQLVKFGCAALSVMLIFCAVAAFTMSRENRQSVADSAEREARLYAEIESSVSLEGLRTATKAALRGRREAERSFSTACIAMAQVSSVVAINLGFIGFVIHRTARKLERREGDPGSPT